MRRHRLDDARLARRAADGALEQFFVHMVPAPLAAARIDRNAARRKHVLPSPGRRRVRILSRQCIRQPDRTQTLRQVRRVLRLHHCEVVAQQPGQRIGQHRHAVLAALAVAHRDLPRGEIDILHPQPHALHQAHSGTVKQARHKSLLQ